MDRHLKIEVVIAINGFLVEFYGGSGGEVFIRKYVASDMKEVTQILDQVYAEFEQVGRQAQKAGEA